MATHLFQIPPDGIFHLYFQSEHPYTEEYIRKVLYEFNGGEQTLPAKVEVKVDDDEEQVMVWFTPDTTLPENDRARAILADLYGWHMKFWGSVIIDGLDDAVITEVLARY